MSDSKNTKEISRKEGEKKKKILISDPEPFIRDTLKIKFASKGYQVIMANTGRDTVRMAAKHTPAIILMEIDYQDLDGFRICQLLKGHKTTAHIPIVVLTKLDDTPERRFTFGPYVKEFMTKPFSPREVARATERVIREEQK